MPDCTAGTELRVTIDESVTHGEYNFRTKAEFEAMAPTSSRSRPTSLSRCRTGAASSKSTAAQRYRSLSPDPFDWAADGHDPHRRQLGYASGGLEVRDPVEHRGEDAVGADAHLG